MTVKIAIVGRPNVGKSTLFNRITGKRLALVHDKPGLTRDRREADAVIGSAKVQLVDTAGLEDPAKGTIEERMRGQTEAALADADILLFLIDARAGLVPADQAFAEMARASGKPVILAANKCEGHATHSGLYEAFSLGMGAPIALSAEHGQGLGELVSALEDALSELPDTLAKDQEAEEKDRPMRVAIVGRPNAGKSTLVNAILGAERMITGPEAGITRDSIAVEMMWKGQDIRLFDTAGLRKKAKVKAGPEHLSVGDALRAIQFAEVIVLLIDALVPFEKQDLQIAALVEREGRALVIAVNKWDLVTGKRERLKELQLEIERLVPQVKGVRLVPVSATKKSGLSNLMDGVLDIYEIWNRRIPTATLNRWLYDAQDRHPPPAVSGKRIRMRFMTQPNARPPTFVVFASRMEKIPESYRRYLVQGLRAKFELPAVPIRLNFKKGKNPYASKR